MLAKGRRDKHDYCGSWRFKGSVFPDQALIFVAENSMNAGGRQKTTPALPTGYRVMAKLLGLCIYVVESVHKINL
jgi:hypothetical protein